MNVGVVSTMFPTRRYPISGVFVKDELDCISSRVGVRLLAPFPNQHWFLNLRQGWERPSYPTKRPFTLAFPRFFRQHWYPESLAAIVRLYGNRLFADCDIIHAHNAFPDGVAVSKVFGGKVPFVITVHGNDVYVFPEKPSLRPGIVSALEQAACVICVSTDLSKTVERLSPNTKRIVIPNGIDTELFSPGDKREACNDLGIDPDVPRLLYAGNFVIDKGLEYLIRAMPDILAFEPSVELIMIGARPGSADHTCYSAEIRASGAGNAIRILDRVPHSDLPRWIQASDIFVLPSLWEGFGIVAAEALACGKPVVSTYSGGPEDIVTDGVGYLVPLRDPGAFAEAVIKVMKHEGIAGIDELVHSARSRFSFTSVADRILDVYQSVIAG